MLLIYCAGVLLFIGTGRITADDPSDYPIFSGEPHICPATQTKIIAAWSLLVELLQQTNSARAAFILDYGISKSELSFWPWYSRHVCRKISSTGKRVDILYENFGYFLHSEKTKSNSLVLSNLLTFSDTTRLSTNRDWAPWVSPFSPLFFCGYWRKLSRK